MLENSTAFSSFSVNNIADARRFYTEELGLEAKDVPMGMEITIKDSTPIYVYEKTDHVPATYTVLNFPVDNIDDVVDDMIDNGVSFEQYDFGDGMATDQKGVMRGLAASTGPDIAWFKDPSGNILAVLQAK